MATTAQLHPRCPPQRRSTTIANGWLPYHVGRPQGLGEQPLLGLDLPCMVGIQSLSLQGHRHEEGQPLRSSHQAQQGLLQRHMGHPNLMPQCGHHLWRTRHNVVARFEGTPWRWCRAPCLASHATPWSSLGRGRWACDSHDLPPPRSGRDT